MRRIAPRAIALLTTGCGGAPDRPEPPRPARQCMLRARAPEELLGCKRWGRDRHRASTGAGASRAIAPASL